MQHFTGSAGLLLGVLKTLTKKNDYLCVWLGKEEAKELLLVDATAFVWLRPLFLPPA